jgi:hypothetical protein
MACSQQWRSQLQVGSHQLARAFVRNGWEVAFVSNPISPFHVLGGDFRGLGARVGSWLSGGARDLEGAVWHYVPAALATPHRAPLLRSEWLHERWSVTSVPAVRRVIQRHGFSPVDLIYFDHPCHHRLLRQIPHSRSVFRLADFMDGFVHASPAMAALERRLAGEVDLVTYPSLAMRAQTESYGPKAHLHLANGVDVERFTRAAGDIPEQYRGFPRPICVYVGGLEDWFDHALLDRVARALPHASFVLIGPERWPHHRHEILVRNPNIHFLGPVPQAEVPRYLQHADVGIIPFSLNYATPLVDILNPLKMYEYFACSLPCVATAWKEISRLRPPAILARNEAEFAAGIVEAAGTSKPRDDLVAYARAHDWNTLWTKLVAALGFAAAGR